jgi:hypothetical protein
MQRVIDPITPDIVSRVTETQFLVPAAAVKLSFNRKDTMFEAFWMRRNLLGVSTRTFFQSPSLTHSLTLSLVVRLLVTNCWYRAIGVSSLNWSRRPFVVSWKMLYCVPSEPWNTAMNYWNFTRLKSESTTFINSWHIARPLRHPSRSPPRVRCYEAARQEC